MRVHVVPYFHGKRIGEISRADVKRYIDHLATLPPLRSPKDATRLAGSTIRKILTPLKAMLAEAYELEIIPTDAARVRVVVENRRVPRRWPKTLNREEIAALTSELDPRDHLLVLLLRWTGLQIAEALGLRWEDLARTDDGPVLHIRRQWQDGRLVEHAKTPPGSDPSPSSQPSSAP
jgi:integrase